MADNDYIGPVVVRVFRADTNEMLNEQRVHNDYFLICNGDRYVKSCQVWGRTHQINVAVKKWTIG